jgi:hypothetical protein
MQLTSKLFLTNLSLVSVGSIVSHPEVVPFEVREPPHRLFPQRLMTLQYWGYPDLIGDCCIHRLDLLVQIYSDFSQLSRCQPIYFWHWGWYLPAFHTTSDVVVQTHLQRCRFQFPIVLFLGVNHTYALVVRVFVRVMGSLFQKAYHQKFPNCLAEQVCRERTQFGRLFRDASRHGLLPVSDESLLRRELNKDSPSQSPSFGVIKETYLLQGYTQRALRDLILSSFAKT